MAIIRSKKRNIIIFLVICLLIGSILFNHQHLNPITASQQVASFEFEQLKEKAFFLESQLRLCTHEKDRKLASIKNSYNNDNNKYYSKFSFNEVDLYPYSAFTQVHYFPAERAIYDRCGFKLSGLRYHYLDTVITKATKHLNEKEGKRYDKADFQMGFERSTPFGGHQCELYFKNKHSSDYIRLEQPLQVFVGSKRADWAEKDEGRQVVNFVLPLSGGVRNRNALRLFLASFELVVVRQDAGLATLTVVLAETATEGSRSVESVVDSFKKRTGFRDIRLVQVLIFIFQKLSISSIY